MSLGGSVGASRQATTRCHSWRVGANGRRLTGRCRCTHRCTTAHGRLGASSSSSAWCHSWRIAANDRRLSDSCRSNRRCTAAHRRTQSSRRRSTGTRASSWARRRRRWCEDIPTSRWGSADILSWGQCIPRSKDTRVPGLELGARDVAGSGDDGIAIGAGGDLCESASSWRTEG